MNLLEAFLIFLIICLCWLIFYFGWVVRQDPEVYQQALNIAIFGIQAMLATRSV